MMLLQGRLALSNWQVKGERASLARFALYLHFAGVGLHDVFDQSETQATPFDIMDQPSADTVESFKDFCLLGRRDSNPVVCDRHEDISILLSQPDPNISRAAGVLDRVIQQVHESLT